jgi:hypothetical protein
MEGKMAKDNICSQINALINELANDNDNLRQRLNETQAQLDKANEQLQKGNIPNVSGQWVSVSEKLPPLDMPIYVYHSIGDYISESHRRTESYFQSKAMQDITYWQKIKIPEKPIDA